MAQARITKLSDLGGLVSMFFMNRIEGQSTERLRDGVKLSDEQQRQSYHLALIQFDAMIDWNRDGVEAALRRTSEVLDTKLKDVIRPMYIAITGAAQGVPLFDAITHLGRDIIRERLRHALELMGTPTKKEAESWALLLDRPAKEG
jgi:glutamyl-tRNA synthetase